ncbi:MAG: lipase family alpha/beta hydrolase [Euzebya sp.]
MNDLDTDDVDGLVALLPQVVQEVVLETVRDTHTAVANRVFGLVPGSEGPRMVHDRIVGMLYAVVGSGVRGTHLLARTWSRFTAGTRDPKALNRNAVWRRTVAIINGVLGDVLAEQGNPLALSMTIRVDNDDVAVDATALRDAFPEATPRVAVLLHGLVENDESWTFKPDVNPRTYAELLNSAGVTPVVLRYNSGRHISATAADLDRLLEDLVDQWPVPLTELILIGHSMGALVIRGAGEFGRIGGRRWPRLASHVVMLGAPHGGAALEKAANAGAWLLAAVPEMAPFSRVLRRRSAGIKDLRHGYLNEEDWFDADPDAWRSRPGRQVDPLDRAAHHLVGATLGAGTSGPLSGSLGDLLVRWGSATAAGRDWARGATVTHIGSANHFALLNHPEVAGLLLRIVQGQAGSVPGRDRGLTPP